MKILIIDVNCKNSSTGKIVYDLYTHLRNSHHEVRVCYGRGPLIIEPEIYKFSSNLEVYAHALLTRLTGLTGNYSPFASRKLIKLIEEFNPDVVHIHELHAYFVNIAPLMRYLKKKNIKTIWTFHCEFMYTGKCGHAYECEKWKNECNHCPQKKEYPSSLIFDFTKKMFHQKKRLFDSFDNLTIITPSLWLADRVKQSFLRDKNIAVIHNGIDTDIFHQRPFDHLKVKHHISDEKIILAVAPDLMSASKGGRFVLEIAKRMSKENIRFVLIGIKDLNEKFHDNIIAMGRTDNQIELAEYYSMADVFLMCSKRETFSLTCVESLSCGTPVIGFKAGAPETIALEEYSQFVDYGDVDEMVKVIHEWIDKKSKISDKLSETAIGIYSKKIMYRDYLKFYSN